MEELAKLIEITKKKAPQKLNLELVTYVKQYNSQFKATESLTRNLNLLDDDKSQFIITGQQTGLFAGPLLTIYKIISAIKLSRILSEQTSKNVLPIFWIQNEDHDVEEIDRVVLPYLPEQVYSLGYSNLDRKSVRDIYFSQNISLLISEIEAKLLEEGINTKQFQKLKLIYSDKNTFSQSFAHYISEIFCEDGLILFDPSSDIVSKILSNKYLIAFDKSREITAVLKGQHTLKEQVVIRDNSPLFFIHLEKSSGPRYRLELKNKDNYQTIGEDKLFERNEIRDIISNSPNRISSSALLRPILQDYLFNSLCYVGGAAEENYYKQSQQIYNFFEVSPSMFVPRASYLLLESKAQRLIGQLGLTEIDLNLSSSEIINKIKLNKLDSKLYSKDVEAKYRSKFTEIFDSMNIELSAFDNAILQQLGRTKEKSDRALDGLFDKYRQIEESKIKIDLERAGKLLNIILPLNKAQERVYSFLYYWCKYGDEILNKLKNNYSPFSRETIKIEL